MSTINMPAGKTPIEGPKPFRVEYPFGLPGDGFRTFAREGKATCVAYHRGVDPRCLESVENGNSFRYGPGDARYEEIRRSMETNGFVGGNGQRVIIHVDGERSWFAEGNHRMKIALEVGVPEVEIEIRYLNGSDETFHLIPFDPRDPELHVISD